MKAKVSLFDTSLVFSALRALSPTDRPRRQAEVLPFPVESSKNPVGLAFPPRSRRTPTLHTPAPQGRPSARTLRKLEFFARMSDEQLKLVARVARVRSFRSGQLVIKENGPADNFFIILAGRVQITKTLENGEQLQLSVETRGKFFGEMALLDERRRSASARALERTILLEVSRNDFRVLLNKAPLLADAMLRVLSGRLREAGDKIVSEMQHRQQELQEAYLDTIKAMVNTLEARDPYTHGHTERVRTIALYIAGRLGLRGQDLFNIAIGALLHDFGKIGVSDAILSKAKALDKKEWADIREHPAKGCRILQHIAFLHGALSCVRHHHERYDGNGYPGRLAGPAIPLQGRIIAVADAFDAMTSNRPYRRRMQVSSALEELKRGAGRQFDPEVVRAFLWVWKHENLAGLVRRKYHPPVAEPLAEGNGASRAAAGNGKAKGLGRLASLLRDAFRASVRAGVRLLQGWIE